MSLDTIFSHVDSEAILIHFVSTFRNSGQDVFKNRLLS